MQEVTVLADEVVDEARRSHPTIRTGQRQLITAEASPAFKDYQRHLAQRIGAIEARKGKVQKGDDILARAWQTNPPLGSDCSLPDENFCGK